MDVDLALALTAGMVVTLNPCGFAMLPAYLSFFAGVEDTTTGAPTDARGSLVRALVVPPILTVGFTATFAFVGLLVNHLTDGAYEVAPWISVVIGVALVGLGIALLAGRDLSVRLPRLDRGGRSGSAGSILLFGVSYAIASLGCSLPLFLATMSLNFGRGVTSGVAYFTAFALGFYLVVGGLTLALALARQSLVRRLRGVMPFIDRVSGALLVVTGAYVTYYGAFEIRADGAPQSDPIVDRATRWSADLQTWVQNRYVELAVLLGVALAAAVLVVLCRPRWRQPTQADKEPASTGSLSS